MTVGLVCDVAIDSLGAPSSLPVLDVTPDHAEKTLPEPELELEPEPEPEAGEGRKGDTWYDVAARASVAASWYRVSIR